MELGPLIPSAAIWIAAIAMAAQGLRMRRARKAAAAATSR